MQQRNKNIPLSASAVIRKLLAGLLVLVFAFGITPKRTLHNLIATHKDAGVVKHDHPGACVSKAVFNCQCDNLVTESPFVAEHFVTSVPAPVHFPGYDEAQPRDFFSAALLDHTLRGPPAC